MSSPLGRRLLGTIAAVGLVVGGLGSGPALAGPPRSAPVPSTAPGPSTPPVAAAVIDPALAIERADGERVRAMARSAAQQSRRLRKARTPDAKIRPIRVAFRGVTSLVLLTRSKPYTLPELAAVAPASLSLQAPGIWLVREPIVVAAGARLVITSDRVAEVRLLSTAGRFASIVGWQATIVIGGLPDHRLRITSWDPSANGPDRVVEDGRAYVLSKGGTFDARDADFTRLGFRTGESSGVAWRGWPGIPSRGSATDASFEANYFGAYTFEAVDMRWTGNVFADNVVYGLDPHDHSNRFIVEGNLAIANGSHGIIFSRGCTANVVRLNASLGNGGGGIVIDDGHLEVDGNPRHQAVVVSSQNVIERNFVLGNAVGVVVEGGSVNAIRANLVIGNPTGVRVKNQAATTSVVGNVVGGSAILGIDINSGSTDTFVSGNLLFGGKVGIAVSDGARNRISANAVFGIDGRGIVVRGQVAGTEVTGNTVAGNGTAAIDSGAATGLGSSAIANNTTTGWTPPKQLVQIYTAANFLRHHPAILIWIAIFLLPLAWWLPARRKRIARWGRAD